MLKSNITREWSKHLVNEVEFSVTSNDGTNCIKFSVDDIKRKVIINEEDCWYVIISYVPLDDLEIIRKIEISSSVDDFCMFLNDLSMIGYYVIAEKGSNPWGNLRKIFMYKTHQRFTRNDDIFNIGRTIKLLNDDHEKYFKNLIEELKIAGPEFRNYEYLKEKIRELFNHI